ncbi:MAG: polysaccharide biosynthesis C-terminal domain-containing protein [Ruminococcus sp.]|nr:polysaccharide biosynthesis C-terminal domain-containing protein [Ruminococcus sp.]
MNKYKKLAFNTIVFAIGNFGSKILLLLLTRLYTKYISPSGNSTKDLLETMALFLIPIFSFGLQEYLIRFALDHNYDKKEVFTTSAGMTAAGLAAMAVIVPLLKFIPFLGFIDGFTILLIIYTCTSTIRMLCAQFVRARDMVKLFSLDGILATLTLFLFNVLFIAKLDMGVKGFMLSVILSDLCSSIFLFITGQLGKFLSIKSFSVPMMKTMLRFSVPLIPTIVMWTITSLSDRVFIREMHSDRAVLGADAAGLYGIANRVPNLISMVSTIFFQAWNMSAITENESDDRSQFYGKVYSAYESILFIACAGLILLVKPVTMLLTNTDNFPEYSTVYIYVPILIAAVLFTSLDQFLGSIYNATKHTKNSFWTALAACVTNLVLNALLIPEWGIQGASIATLVSYLICFWLRIIDARYYVPFSFNMIKNIFNTIVLLIMCGFVIVAPPKYMLWQTALTLVVCVGCYQEVLTMAKKLLKRG